MKRIQFFLILIIICLIHTGCFLKSVHPLVTEEEATLIEGVEGIWESGDERWTFINDLSNFPRLSHLIDEGFDEVFIENGYVILYERSYLPSDTAVFIGLIGEFNGAYFLDLSVLTRSTNELEADPDFIYDHYYPVHTFSKITLEEGNLKLEFFASSFIRGLIQSNQMRIKYEEPEDAESILITASTRELQRFVEKYGEDESAFEGTTEFTYLGYGNED